MVGVSHGAIPLLVKSLESSEVDSVQEATVALMNLADLPELKLKIGAAPVPGKPRSEIDSERHTVRDKVRHIVRDIQ